MNKRLTFRSILREHKWRLAGVLALLAGLSATNMALPLSLKLIVDDVFPGPSRAGDWGLLWVILPALTTIYVVRNILFYASRMIAAHIGEDICLSLRSRLFERLQQMSVGFYRGSQPGGLSSRVMDDTYKLLIFLQERLPTLGLNLLMALTLVTIIYVIDWRLAIVGSVMLPFHYATHRYFAKTLRRSHASAQDTIASAHGDLVERFLGMEVVKIFAAEQRERARFNRIFQEAKRRELRTKKHHFVQKVTADLLSGLGVVTLLGFGAWQVVNGSMTTGEFFMFFGYAMMLYPAVLDALSGASHFAKAQASLDRITEVMEMHPTESGVLEGGDSAAGRKSAEEMRGAVEFRAVQYTYPDGTHVLDGLSFAIAAGEKIAVMGPSGAGKTTMASLIPRFHAPTSGAVLIDGRDVREWSIRELRRSISMSFENAFLFNCSIFENLLYGRTDATTDEIVEACQITGAHDFIEELELGYDSTPSELGGRLSRGQMQRLTLARAVLKKPRLLIMDEATASLDATSGEEVVRRIFEHLKESTIIIITHDLKLAKLADRVITIEQGRAVDESATDASVHLIG